MWGHSQGGHAALFTGEEAASYAPELKLVGVAAAAPATYLGELFRADIGSLGGNSLTAMTLLSWSKVYNIPLDSVLVPAATRTFEAVARSCIERITELLRLEEIEQPLQHAFLKVDPTTIEPWRGHHENEYAGPGAGRRTGFHRAGHGRRSGAPRSPSSSPTGVQSRTPVVEMKMLEGVSHSFAGYDSADEAVAWMADRFRGQPAPNGCGTGR